MLLLQHRVSLISAALIVLALGGCVHEPMRGAHLFSQPGDKQTHYRFGLAKHNEAAAYEATEQRQRLEYAFEYALEYGISCALKNTLQKPSKEIQENPARAGLEDSFDEALEWGLRHILESDQKNVPQEVCEAARAHALEHAKSNGITGAIDEALKDIPNKGMVNDAEKEDLKKSLLKALTDCIDESFDSALGLVLHGEPEMMQTADGSFLSPINHSKAYITSTFGSQGKARGGQGGRRHTGIDIVVPQCTPVTAAANGEVTFPGESGSGYGRLIKLVHADGVETWYAHLNSFDVREGDQISGGAKIGEVGQTGRATCPHLHYEVHENGRAVDPRPYLP